MGDNDWDGGHFSCLIGTGILSSREIHRRHPEFPKKIAHIKDYAEERMSTFDFSFKINIHPKYYDSASFLGRVYRYGPSAEIICDRSQDLPWRRFIVTKEICHIIYHPAGVEHLTASTQDVEELITELMADVQLPAQNQTDGTVCDKFGMLMALEMLLPHHQRADIERKILDGKTESDIANQYNLPATWVKFFRSKMYCELMDHHYAKVSK